MAKKDKEEPSRCYFCNDVLKSVDWRGQVKGGRISFEGKANIEGGTHASLWFFLCEDCSVFSSDLLQKLKYKGK